MKTIEVTDEQYEVLKELSDLRKTQDNRCTADPIWLVQVERTRVCDPEYSAEYKYTLTDDDGDAIDPTLDFEYFKKQVKDYLEEYTDEIEFEDDSTYGCYSFDELDNFSDLAYWVEKYREIEMNYGNLYVITIESYYETVAYFFTDQEAKRYLKYQSHNLTNPRTYVDHIGYSNYGYLPKLMDILEKVEL